MRIAMWSGPRNLSTAMMYSFGARNDFAVSDEPFYGAYLKATGIIHPMQTEILASQNLDPNAVADHCKGPLPERKKHWYQKHMCQHMINSFPLDWARSCQNIFLIRHPARVIASYAAKREEPTLEDIGFLQQCSIFDKFGGTVIDSSDILQNPKHLLSKLCKAIDLPFDDVMLNWPAGGHKSDGVWAKHWYANVHNSTGFLPYKEKEIKLSSGNLALAKRCKPYYEFLTDKSIQL
jgi:hypothetical protein